MFVFRVTDIPVRVERTQILATHRFHVQRGFYLCGDVLCVHVVQDVLEGRDVHAARVIDGVNIVIHRNEAHALFGEVNLGVLSAHDIVPPKP